MPGLQDKLDFLRSPAAHAGRRVRAIETHMSWVFLIGRRVLKLKKPARLPYLDFSTLAAREFHCREELRLNSRLAPDVYLGLVALCRSDNELMLVPEQELSAGMEVIDWLVQMRRLPATRMLDALIRRDAVTEAETDRLGARLLDFYLGAQRLETTAADYLAHFAREQAINRSVLLQPRFRWRGAAAALDALDDALQADAALLGERARHLVDGHGDLRPEHVCLLDPPRVIDALEFNAALRRIDPLEELTFLGMECEAAGARWIGPRLLQRCAPALDGAAARRLVPLYGAYRALLRARLAAAHLLEAEVRHPRRWRPQAQRYLDLAAGSLAALAQLRDQAD